jgi:hypothetical protein
MVHALDRPATVIGSRQIKYLKTDYVRCRACRHISGSAESGHHHCKPVLTFDYYFKVIMFETVGKLTSKLFKLIWEYRDLTLILWGCFTTLSLSTLYSGEWKYNWWIGNSLERSGRGVTEVLHRHLSGGIEENHVNLGEVSRCHAEYQTSGLSNTILQQNRYVNRLGITRFLEKHSL